MRKSVQGALAVLLITGSATAAMAQGARLQTVPKSVKYKTAGAKPATGRSGSASLEARVLIAKDHSMLLEAATNGVEAASNPGTITKMQVKIGADFTQNHNGLNAGGYWKFTMLEANRATPIQLQAGIKGIDPKRTDVVTVTTPALLRPDIAVDAVNGPAQHSPNTPVTFIATVSEKNGDVAATSNCVLSIAGTVVDTATDVLVDAGGVVSCEFTHTFPTPGDYAVSVAATGVNPGDWDLANNSAETTIKIVNPESKIAYGSLSAWQQSYAYDYEYVKTAGLACQNGQTYYCNISRLSRDYRNISEVNFWGYNYGVNAALLTQLDVKVLTNGALSASASLTPMNNYSYESGAYYYNCAWYYEQSSYDPATNRHYYSGMNFQMCSNGERNTANQWADYHLYRRAGDVTYMSTEVCDQLAYQYNYCGYYWNQRSGGETHANGEGLSWTGGTQVGLQLTFHLANGLQHTADRSVTIQTQYANSYGWGPYSYYDEWNGTSYESYRSSNFYGYGSTSWSPWSDGQ